MKCHLCNISISYNEDDDNIAVKKDDLDFCLKCSEVYDFSVELDNSPVEEKIIEKPQKIVNKILCPKCKEEYNGNKCSKCDLINPLAIRKPKTKRKRRKKS